MRKKEKVLMVHNFYQIGGGEHTVFANEVKLLRDHGHEVTEYTRSNDELKNSKIKLLLSPFSTIWSFKTYTEVKRIIKEQKIEIVHCHNTFPLISPSVYYAAISCGVPIVQTIHNFRFLCPNGTFFCNGEICEKCREKNSFKDAIKNRCYRSSKIQTMIVVAMLKFHRLIGTYKKINYIFLTDFNRTKFSNLIDINGKNVFVKPNFVSEERPDEHIPSNKVFVFAGRLEENKGIKLLIERWKLLPKNCLLHIYGDGTLREFVEETCKAVENISYFGFKPQEDIFRELQSATALVFPSIWYEGFPMIIAESFSIGCPVLTTNIGNQADLIMKVDGGAVFDPDSEETFVEAITKLIEDNGKLSENAKNYYNSSLNKDSNYSGLSTIYGTSIIQNKGGYSEVVEKHVFVFAGRLDEAKGILFLLDAWNHMPDNYELRIMGTGDFDENVKNAESKHENIVYLGFQSHDVIMNELEKATAMVFPSRLYEGFPMTISESIAQGCPVISSNIGNQASLIEASKAGCLFELDNIESFAQAIDQVITNREEYSKMARGYYEENLMPYGNYKRMIEIYERAEIFN